MKHLTFIYIFILLIAIFSCNTSPLAAQDKLNFSKIDGLTYEYYTQQKWDELISLGKESLKNDIDFYYLQYRMGIAYYSQNNYRKAIPYFENVVNKTPEDAIALEYLYYSYLLGMRIEDAKKTLHSFDIEHREKVTFYNQKIIINSLALGYKYTKFDEYAISNEVTSSISQKIRRSMEYYSANLFSFTTKSSDFDVNFSLLNGENSIYNATYSTEPIDEKMSQYQLYLAWNINIAKGSSLKLSLAYMQENLDWYDSIPTLIYNGNFNNVTSYISYTKSIQNVDLSLSSSFSMLDSITLAQPSISIKYFPFGNTLLYTETSAFYQYNFSNQNNNNITFKQSINSNINPKLKVNIFGLYGEIYNFVNNDGMSIYNMPDALNYWYGASVNYNIKNKVQLYLILRNDGLINYYTQNDIIIDNPYNAKSIFAGINYNF